VIVPQLRPAGTLSVRATVPVNPLVGVRVIVELVVDPAFMDVGEVAVIVKLCGAANVNEAVAE